MLRKKFQRVTTPGQPEVPADPGGYYCYSPPPTGYWETRCSTVTIYPNTGVPVPAGVTNIVYVKDEFGNLIKIVATICASVFVSTGPSGPPVCTYVPPREYQPAIPYRVEQRPTVGWDAGANSVQERAADCELRWTMGLVVGVYVGFPINMEIVELIERYSHSIYFHQKSGRPMFRIIEQGEARGFDTEYTPGDEFAIRRVNERVSYWRNGEKLQDSTITRGSELFGGSSLYVSGDMIP